MLLPNEWMQLTGPAYWHSMARGPCSWPGNGPLTFGAASLGYGSVPFSGAVRSGVKAGLRGPDLNRQDGEPEYALDCFFADRA
jgi:hypothetical protein